MAKLKSVGIRLTEAQHAALKDWAEFDRRSVASLVEIKMDEALNARPPELVAAINARKAERGREAAKANKPPRKGART